MRVEASTYKGHYKPSINQAVKNKLKVLQEFHVFYKDDSKAREKFEQMLLDAVARYPNRDYEIVIDQIGTQIIMDSFS